MRGFSPSHGRAGRFRFRRDDSLVRLHGWRSRDGEAPLKNDSASRKWIATSLSAAFAGSLCCVGPLALSALGFSAAAGALGAFFSPLRPWLLVLAFGISMWRLATLYAARRGAEPVVDGEPNLECPLASYECERRPTSSSHHAIPVAWVALAAVVFLSGLPALQGMLLSFPNNSAPVITSGSLREGGGDVCLRVSGLTCATCAKQLEAVLSKVAGVRSARVFFESDQACIEILSPDSRDSARLIEAVAAAGYRAETQVRPASS